MGGVKGGVYFKMAFFFCIKMTYRAHRLWILSLSVVLELFHSMLRDSTPAYFRLRSQYARVFMHTLVLSCRFIQPDWHPATPLY